MTLRTVGGRVMEADGRPIMGRAVLRIRDVSGDRLELMHLQDQHVLVADEALAMRGMLDALPHPLWLRDHDGRLTWVNAAYARAVEAPNGLEAVVRGIELLDRAVRDDAAEDPRSRRRVSRPRPRRRRRRAPHVRHHGSGRRSKALSASPATCPISRTCAPS